MAHRDGSVAARKTTCLPHLDRRPQYLARLHLHADVVYENPTDEGAGEMLGLKRNGLMLRTCRRAQSCFGRFRVADESGRPCDSWCRHVFASLSIVPFSLGEGILGRHDSVALGCELIRQGHEFRTRASLAGNEFDRTRSALACV